MIKSQKPAGCWHGGFSDIASDAFFFSNYLVLYAFTRKLVDLICPTRGTVEVDALKKKEHHKDGVLVNRYPQIHRPFSTNVWPIPFGSKVLCAGSRRHATHPWVWDASESRKQPWIGILRLEMRMGRTSRAWYWRSKGTVERLSHAVYRFYRDGLFNIMCLIDLVVSAIRERATSWLKRFSVVSERLINFFLRKMR